MSARADDFLQQYRVLEELLTKKYADSRRHSSVVMDFLNDVESQPYREEMDLCREVRNLLTHRSSMEGEMLIEPSQALVDMLREIVAYVKRPPLAMDFATPIGSVLFTDLEQPALPLMRQMDDRGYSHVPVLDKDGRFYGVFSKTSVFSYVLQWKDPVLNEKTTIYHFRKFLPVNKHHNERFLFMDEGTTLMDVKAEFESHSERSRRLVAIFITKGGEEGGPLMGLLTPWDVLGKKIKILDIDDQ